MIKKIFTADNTETFLNEEVGESYHSQTGAVEEAFKKYAIPCKIKELAQTGKITILDVCSGLIYNAAAAIDTALKENPDCQIEVVCLENDLEIIKKIGEVDPPIKNYHLIKRLFQENNQAIQDKRDLVYHKGNIKITILMGDARERIKELNPDHFDAVFMDPFSPKTAPEMWTKDFFKDIFQVIKQNRVLATYTCARLARDNMKEAGFMYDDGPIVGRRGPGTIATKWVF
tara:strand:+ start:1138 stop:1827 length:690 start_codon:yes stop_codon:yes gene_type:complete